MKISIKPSWRNNKCNECGKPIFINKKDQSKMYFCYPEYVTPFRAWKFCKSCFKKIFKEVK